MPPYKSESPRSGSPVPGPSTDAQSSGSPSCSKINHDISVDDDLGPRARKGKLPSVTESSAIKDDVEGRVISTSNGQFYENSIVWKNIILFVFLHSSLLYCLYALLVDWPWRTLFFCESNCFIHILNTITFNGKSSLSLLDSCLTYLSKLFTSSPITVVIMLPLIMFDWVTLNLDSKILHCYSNHLGHWKWSWSNCWCSSIVVPSSVQG